MQAKPAINRAKPWTVRLLHTLYERGPQKRENLIDEASLLVPPGRAVRRFDNHRAKRLGHRREPSIEAKIQSGSRWVVMESIRILRVHGRLREYEEDGVKMVALTEIGIEKYFV